LSRTALAALVLSGGLIVTEPSPAGAATVSIFAMGDVAGCTSGHQPKGSKATVDLIAGLSGQLALLGDVVQGPSAKLVDYRNCYDPHWGRFRSRTRPVPGNHDYLASGANGYFDYWGSIAGARGQGYYAWQAGAWRIYALNSNCGKTSGCGPGSPMYTWLRNQLASSSSTCQLAYFHHGRWSQGQHGPNSSMSAIYQLLYRAGAELVLSGHDHTYQRFPALDPSGQRDSDGIVQIIAGTGGASHYGFTGKGPAPVVKNNTAFGVVALDLSDSSWSLRFVPEPDKSFRDSASGQCRGPNGSL
jgi:hypothetical protein